MPNRWKDVEHLIRLAALFAAGMVALLVLRGLLTPDDFGKFGHFRAAALDANASEKLTYAGRQACADCHDDVVASRVGGTHERVGCETCHGALATHAADPLEVTPELPDPGTLCLGCHHQNGSRPEWFPQVDEEEHAQGEPCVSCHDPHSPGL